MSASTASAAAIGFLSAIERAPHGLFGGYLLLNAAGRPLEFHCTVPVKPNRAQQILYGPTLEPFLYGEQIGATLVNKSALRPLVVLVDVSPMLAVRQHIDLPTALVTTADASPSLHLPDYCSQLPLGRNLLAVPARYAADGELIRQRLAALDDLFDLVEPFSRIREAIEEADRGAAKAA